MRRWAWMASAALLAPTVTDAREAVRDTVRLEEVVVIGTRVAGPQKDLPVSVSVISGETLKSAGTVGEAISTLVPGVFVTQRGLLSYGTGAGSAGSLTIRGVGNSTTNSQILVLVDGRPDFMGVFGHPLMEAYRTDGVERVEVIRGPASALYGTNAMGGAVNIVTRRRQAEGHRSAATVMLGSHDTREYLSDMEGRSGRVDYGLSLSRRQTDGHRPDNAFRTTNLSARFGVRTSGVWSVLAGGYLAKFLSHDPGSVFAPTPGRFADILRSGMDLTVESRTERAEGMVKVHGTFGKHRLWDGFRSTDRVLGLVAFEEVRPRAGTKLSLGFDLKRYGGKARNANSGADFGRHFVTEAAPHAHLQQVVAQKVILRGGLRLEHHSLYGGTWVPTAGVVVQPEDRVSLKFAVSRGFHSPTVKDLYLPFPAANPDLDPERLWSVEGGGEVRIADRFGLDVTFYRMKGEGIIQPVFGPGGPRMINGGKFASRGAEVSVRALLAPDLRGTLTYAYYNQPEKAPGTPGHALSLSLTGARGPVSLSVTGEQVRGLYGLTGQPARLVGLESYGVVNVRGEVRLSPRLGLHAQVDNVFDNTYETMVGYPMPGATVRAGLTVNVEGPRR